MCTAAAILSPPETVVGEDDHHRMDGAPLRTATGFVLGVTLSGGFWVAAALLAWYVA